MSGSRKKSSFPKVFDLPLAIGLALTAIYYVVIHQAPFKDGMLYQYTTEHIVEYAIMAFFMWGVTDAILQACRIPRELAALRQQWLVRRKTREPVSRAAAYLQELEQRPGWVRNSRIGQRFIAALSYVDERGSADDLADQLRYLSEQDFDKTQANFALLRFICWVTPMFGFLGTVLHFGTALGGQTAGDLADKLPKVVAEMGTAFNTTTVALTVATTMMFLVFLCERAERTVLGGIDERVEEALVNRFETADGSLAPFLTALRETNHVTLEAVRAAVTGQVELWKASLQELHRQWHEQQTLQSQAWAETLAHLEQRFEAGDENRQRRLAQLLTDFESERRQQAAQVDLTVERVAGLKGELGRFVETMGQLAGGRGELVALEASLAQNLRILGESQHFEQAMHELTAAIHLMTARSQSRAA